MSITVLLVDDHQIFRQGLQSLINSSGVAQVIGLAGDGAEAVRLAGVLQPELVVMDLTMPIMNGIDATREIKKQYPGTKILVLSMENDRFFVVEAIKAGATGYLLKDAAFDEMTDALNTVARGEIYLPAKISTVLVNEFLQRIPEDVAVTYQKLTSRERKLLQLIADGKGIKEIAYLLDLSSKTVENHRQSIMQKLDLFTIAELTKYAVRHGFSSL